MHTVAASMYLRPDPGARRVLARVQARSHTPCRDRGMSTVEAVIVLPLLVLLTLVVVQSAQLWHARHVAQAASHAGVQAARGYGAATDGREATLAYLQAVAPRLLRDPQVVATRTATTVTVSVSAHIPSVVPGLHLGVQERSGGTVERFVAPAPPP